MKAWPDHQFHPSGCGPRAGCSVQTLADATNHVCVTSRYDRLRGLVKDTLAPQCRGKLWSCSMVSQTLNVSCIPLDGFHVFAEGFASSSRRL